LTKKLFHPSYEYLELESRQRIRVISIQSRLTMMEH